jgi:hypothetical protein
MDALWSGYEQIELSTWDGNARVYLIEICAEMFGSRMIRRMGFDCKLPVIDCQQS